MRSEPINKTLLYTLDPEVTYTYNIHHGTEYPYNGFPPGIQGKRYKKTRFIEWEPIPEDIIIRHHGSQVFMNFTAVFPNNQDVMDPNIQIFQLRSKKVDIQNYICEQINFFCALYDDDNELITNMLIAKYITDSGEYNIRTFDDYHKMLFRTLFSDRIIDKIRKMVEENDVGDDVIGLFPEDCLRDIYMVSFMIKVMRIYIEHFIISTGNVPKDLYELFATAYTNAMNYINPNMYVLLYNYVNKNYTEVPIGSIIAIISALTYFISPVDMIPDAVPGLGYMDDAAVITACLALVHSDLTDYQKWREENSIETTLEEELSASAETTDTAFIGEDSAENASLE